MIILGLIFLALYLSSGLYNVNPLARVVLFIATVVCLATGLLNIINPIMMGR